MYASSFFPFLPTSLEREYNAVSAKRSMEFGNIVQVETSRYLTKITTLQRKADRLAFATIAMYSWWQLGEIECVPNLKSAEGGG